MNLLLLWDIDGTLIRSGGAGARAFDAALLAEFSIEESASGIEFAGRTDRWIARQLFERSGIDPVSENFQRLFERYYSLLPAALAECSGFVIPGVAEIVEEGRRRGHIAQGLLTGNLRRGAEIKLTHYGIWHHFPFGAFGDDAELRNELGPHAIRRAEEHARRSFPAERVWVIGDTPHDIACGRAVGARSLAVAAGSFTAAQLAGHGPDVLLEDYSDTDRFFSLLES